MSGDRSFEVHKVHLVTRIRPNAPLLLQAIVHLAQDTTLPADENDPESIPMDFDGGSTVVVELDDPPAISYCIRKPMTSTTRRQRQRAYRRDFADRSLQSTYFGVSTAREERAYSAREPFALIHRGV
jgi:hypothetical protein